MRKTKTGKVVHDLEETKGMDFPYPPEPQEDTCPTCGGTGKVTACSLCNGLGVVGKNIIIDGIVRGVTARPCPNGCPQPEAKL